MAPPRRRKRHENNEPDRQESALSPKKSNSLANFLKSPNGKQSSNGSSTQSRLPSRSRVPPRFPTKSPSTSPEKTKRKLNFDDEKGKSADLKAMFSKQAQNKRPSSVNAASSGKDLEIDPISDGEDVSFSAVSSTSIVGQAARKRQKTENGAISTQPTSTGVSMRTRSHVPASGIFLNPSLPKNGRSSERGDGRPWSERFAPTHLDELAVHKKKVSDVRAWLEGVIQGKVRQRLLVLKGAAGTGKTTTIKLLADEIKCELLEWKNPGGSGLGFSSFSVQFEEFMARGDMFSQLDMGEESDEEMNATVPPQDPSKDHHEQKLILIEEFPNTFSRSSSALAAFRRAILAYLANNTPSFAIQERQTESAPITPVVMVISETLLTTTSASADSFTAHRLLGPEILQHPGTAVIEFNNIAPTILAKALDLVVRKEARKSGRRRTPGPQVLKQLGEIGDIRSAISALQFLCIKGDEDADWGSRVVFTKTKKASKPNPSLTKDEQASLELVTQRESSLGIFHAVGKVVYNKRDESCYAEGTPEAKAENLPGYLEYASRPRKSQVSVDSLMDETGTDTGTFISALHENYPLSCVPTGPEDMNSSLDYISNCLEYLSASDLLCPSWDVFFGGKGPGAGFKDTGSHILRQDEMGFQVAARGLLFSLPYPVKRIPSAAGGRGQDAFKMFFPASIKLWRAKEELEGTLDIWANKLLHGDAGGKGHTLKGIMDGAGAFSRAKAQGVEAWASNRDETKQSADEAEESTTLVSLGSSARKELVLERLPFMALIARARKAQLGSAAALRELEKVVSFKGGLRVTDDEDGDEEDAADGPGESWATDKPAEETQPPWRRSKIVATGDSEVPGAVGQDLFLAFDDIED